MKKLFIMGVLIFSTFNVIGQTKNQVKFKAVIANRNSDTLVIRGANKFSKIIPINKKGVFESEFEAPKGLYQFSDGTEGSMLYLKEGSEINLTMDAKKFDETIVYSGKGTNESNFLAQAALADENFEKEVLSKDPTEFEKLLEAKKAANLDKLTKGDYDPDFKTMYGKIVEQFNAYMRRNYKNVSKVSEINGKPSPTFDFENHKGGKTKLSDFKGKYVYIDVWATWCAPCRKEIPFLQEMEKKYHSKNIEFVSISIDALKDHEKWKNFVTEKNLGGTQLFADNSWESEFVVNYGITGIPRFILVDPNGNILNASAEKPSSPELQTILDNLLK